MILHIRDIYQFKKHVSSTEVKYSLKPARLQIANMRLHILVNMEISAILNKTNRHLTWNNRLTHSPMYNRRIVATQCDAYDVNVIYCFPCSKLRNCIVKVALVVCDDGFAAGKGVCCSQRE